MSKPSARNMGTHDASERSRAPVSHAPERRARRASGATGLAGRMTACVLQAITRRGHDALSLCARASLPYDELSSPTARIAYPAVDALVELAASLVPSSELARSIIDAADDETYARWRRS